MTTIDNSRADALTDRIKAMLMPWPPNELGPTDEPESQYRFGYNNALEDVLTLIEQHEAAPAELSHEATEGYKVIKLEPRPDCCDKGVTGAGGNGVCCATGCAADEERKRASESWKQIAVAQPEPPAADERAYQAYAKRPIVDRDDEFHKDKSALHHAFFAGIKYARHVQSEPPAGDPATHCQCPACADGTIHASDCAVHNAPALPVGPCDCVIAPKQLATGKAENFDVWLNREGCLIDAPTKEQCVDAQKRAWDAARASSPNAAAIYSAADFLDEVTLAAEELEKKPETGRRKVASGYDEGFNDALDALLGMAKDFYKNAIGVAQPEPPAADERAARMAQDRRGGHD